jgi:hypothetical protein
LPTTALGRSLVEIRYRSEVWQRSDKGISDGGGIAFLVDPLLAEWEEVSVPAVEWDLRYNHSRTYGHMLRVHHSDRRGTFNLLLTRRAPGTQDVTRGSSELLPAGLPRKGHRVSF